ncbi:Uu.00g106550.m01.CDS01 [Anthostomella pinea]|uniref:Uu.00g106550.m01.CDS01 n=1 Tax=Anthostomella pinea TaxID=933095 RepID=A0AAI8VE10_9PEZI|nr:Uu.00g106550.m01.CDS01 [Anthostomella pinea]
MSTSHSTATNASISTSMSTSLGTSARISNVGRASKVLSKVNTGHKVSTDEIVRATGELPNIAPGSLKPGVHLGQGTSFQVSRDEYHKHGGTPYYVAVKRFVDSSAYDNDKVPGHYASFLREVAVLLHPPIRTHGCFIRTIACGWDDRPSQEFQPYLVMDYSIHGTLPQYLRRCRIPPSERQELALDVTSGLKFLHECHIIHGDIKPNNILIYDNTEVGGDGILRPQVAKLSDFSSARFSQDFQDGSNVQYDGTPKYNAPEIEHTGQNLFTKEPGSLSLFAKADIYSLGLLIWETMNNGGSYINKSHLLLQEGEQQYLRRILANDVDAVRNLALDYFQSTKMFSTSSVLGNAVKEATIMCLFGNPFQREDLSKVLTTLAGGTKEERPRQSTAMDRYNPLGTNMDGLDFGGTKNRATSQQRNTTYTLMPATSDDFIVRTPTDDSLAVVSTAAPVPSMEVGRVSLFERSEFDVFKSIETPILQDLDDLGQDAAKSDPFVENTEASNFIDLRKAVLRESAQGGTEISHAVVKFKRGQTARHVGTIGDEHVVLETFSYTANPDDGAPYPATAKQVKHISGLLAAVKQQQNFRILPFRGFFHNKVRHEFGLVFDRPPSSDAGNSFCSLRDLYKKHEIVPLGHRVYLIHALCVAMQYFHRVKWVHKGIRSANIAFNSIVGDEGSISRPAQGPKTVEDLVKQEGPGTTAGVGCFDLAQPYLFGFEYARADDQGTNREEDYTPQNNMYRHPDRWGRPRVDYTKTHDVYALGVVMLEVALWRDIESICKTRDQKPGNMSASYVYERAKKKCQGEVGHRVGDVLAQAIVTCLDFADLTKDMSEYDSHLCFQHRVESRVGQIVGKV